MAATPDFGSPPSPDVPILFNDHHVYAKPDRLRAGRVLAAIVRGNTILVPLRSVFELMGARVSFDEATKMVAVEKPGYNVEVTVGKPEVVVNGETRPLDVPPEIDRGTLLVPLRVISEGMGAYVEWAAAARTVVIRYLPAPAPSVAPAATSAPSPSTSATPAPPPAAPSPPASPNGRGRASLNQRAKSEQFIVGDYVINPSSYSELNAGGNAKASLRTAVAFEFPVFKLPWMLEGDFRSYRYAHGTGPATACNAASSGNASCANAVGKQGLVYVPAFDARDDDVDARFAFKLSDPRIYIGIGYEFRNTNYEGGSFPTQQHGLGVGLEKLPDLDQAFSLFGSAYYYPLLTTNGSQDLGDGSIGEVQYRYLKYDVGLILDFGRSPLFLEGGYLGDRGTNKQNAPSDFTHQGPYAGLGIHF
jgi:hypothetical protein